MEPMLILVRGLPGSGKTTLAEVLFNHYLEKGADVVALATDDYMMEDGKYVFHPENLAEAHIFCQIDAATFLDKGYVVIVHNTFTRQWEANPYIQKAKEVGATIQIIHTQGPWNNQHGCPPKTIEKMKARWENVSY